MIVVAHNMHMWLYAKIKFRKRYLYLSTHYKLGHSSEIIRESVDSLCRDDADMPMPPYIQKAYNRPNAAFVSLFR